MRHRRRGAALVEFALAGALLCLLLFGIIEAGLLFGDQAQVGAAAREAARSLAVGEPTATARTRGLSAASGLSASALALTFEGSTDSGGTWTALADSGGTNAAASGSMVRATVTYSHPLISSFLFSGTARTLTARLVMRRE